MRDHCNCRFLGLVYNVTKAPIAAQEEKTKQDAYKAVFTDVSEFKETDLDQDAVQKVLDEKGLGQNTITEIAKAVDKNGETLGYVFSVTNPEGYGGDISLSVGVRNDGTVNGYETLTINETAGLGMKATEDEFKSQFNNKKAEQFEVVKDGSGADDDAKIDAISGATITSRAVTSAVNSCVAYVNSLKGGNRMNPNPMERLINGIIKENPTLRPDTWYVSDAGCYHISNQWCWYGIVNDSRSYVFQYGDFHAKKYYTGQSQNPGYIVVIASLVTVVQFLLGRICAICLFCAGTLYSADRSKLYHPWPCGSICGKEYTG